MRNLVSNQLMREASRDMWVPEYELVKFYLNGVYHGLMLNSEKPNKRFFRKHGGDGADLEPSFKPSTKQHNATFTVAYFNRNGGARLQPLPSELYKFAFDKVGDGKRGDLVSFVEDTIYPDHQEATARRTRKATNVELVNDWVGMVGLVYGHDMVKKNYFMTRQAGKWFFIPWDLDLTLGCTYREDGVTPGQETFCINDMIGDYGGDDLRTTPVDFFSADADDVIAWKERGTWNLWIDNIMRDTAWRTEFNSNVCRILNSQAYQNMPNFIDAMATFITDAVYEDTSRRESQVGGFEDGVDALKTWWADREKFVRADLECGELPLVARYAPGDPLGFSLLASAATLCVALAVGAVCSGLGRAGVLTGVYRKVRPVKVVDNGALVPLIKARQELLLGTHGQPPAAVADAAKRLFEKHRKHVALEQTLLDDTREYLERAGFAVGDKAALLVEDAYEEEELMDTTVEAIGRMVAAADAAIQAEKDAILDKTAMKLAKKELKQAKKLAALEAKIAAMKEDKEKAMQRQASSRLPKPEEDDVEAQEMAEVVADVDAQHQELRRQSRDSGALASEGGASEHEEVEVVDWAATKDDNDSLSDE